MPLMPAHLRPGGTIGITAPAGHVDRESFDRGMQVLKSFGFEIILPQDLFATRGYFAGPDEHRASLVNRLFSDPSVEAIICARGGFGSMRMLPYLDFTSIRQNPKIIVGFSDISALLSALYERCDLVTFHGPVVTSLADGSQETIDGFFAALTGSGDRRIFPRDGQTLAPGSATGTVSGGNLTTLCHLIGTPFQPRYKGRLLLLEDKGEASYRIDRMLTQMKLAGCFEGLAGLFLGSFEDCGSANDIYDIVADIFSGDSIPILAGFGIGHGKHNQTIPLGMTALLDADNQFLSY